MIRVVIEAHCAAPACKRFTTATAVYAPKVESPSFGKLSYTPAFTDIRFPLRHDGGGTEWAIRDGETWCPEDAEAKKP